MAKRFHTYDIKTNRGNIDVIEIHDEDWSGSSTLFDVGPDGYYRRYDADIKDRFAPVTPSTLEFEMQISSTAIETFISELKTSKEGRFKVKLIRNSHLTWAGVVTIDIGHYEDISKPYGFSVVATDLGRLATIKYKDVSGPFDGWATFIEHIQKVITFTGLTDFAWPSSAMFSTIADWYEDSMSTGAANDPIALTRCHHRAFYDVDSKGNFQYMSCLDVLSNIMRIMGCNIRQSDGRFRVFQIPQFENATPTARHYDKDGTYLSNSSDTYTTTINQTNTGARLAGGRYTWLAPLQSVKLRYVHKNWTNAIAGASWSNGTADFDGPDLNADANPFAIICQFTLARTLINGSNPTGQPYFEKYRLKFKVGAYYLRRNIIQVASGTIQYESAMWTTSPSEYFFHLSNDGYFPAIGGSGFISSTVDFTVPPFPADGASTFNIQSAGFVTTSGAGAGITFGAASTSTGYIAINQDTQATDAIYTVDNPDTTANSVAYDITTMIGSGTTANSVGRLQVFNGSTWSNANANDGWTVGGAGTEQTLQDLLITEIMAGQRAPIPVMQHTVGYTNFEPHHRLYDGTDYWALLAGTYTAVFDDWQGTWAKVARDPIGITVNDSYETPSDGPFGPPIKNGGIYVPPPDLPTPPQSPGPNPQNPDLEGFILTNVSGISTAVPIAAGSVSVIQLNQTTKQGGYQAGQTITLIDPVNLITSTFTVTSDTNEGDTFINVSGYALAAFPSNSVILTPQSATVSLSTSTNSNPSEDSNWWSIFQQWWEIDQTNDINWPIESPNVGFETDENAGNGSTAGFRLDGAGMQGFKTSGSNTTFYLNNIGGWQFRNHPNAGNGSTAGIRLTDSNGLQLYKSTSATPTFTLNLDGSVTWNHAAHPTVTAGMMYVLNGIIYTETTGAGTKAQPQFGHTRHFQVIGFGDNWATGAKAVFWRVTSEFAGHEIWQIGYGVGSTSGSGSGSNQCYCYHENSTGSTTTALLQMTCDSDRYQTKTTVTSLITLTAGDCIYFNVSAIKSTPAKGLFVELYLRKT